MFGPQEPRDGLCRAEITIQARQLLGLVCRQGGLDCPLISADEAEPILERLACDPTVTVRLCSDADCIPHYTHVTAADYEAMDPVDVLNRKRDLDVLQKLGLCPGDTRRSRYLIELLFEQLQTPRGICAYATPGWEGCELATSGAYERVRDEGWREMVYCRSDEERAEFRAGNALAIAQGDRIFMRLHHLMCMCCWYRGGEASGLRPNDTLAEILQRIQAEPDVPITLVEGQCEACDCCDGFHPDTGRCVHAGGLIRDFKKDLDCFQVLGLMPGATLPARELMDLIFDRIGSTTEICGYGDGVATANEWRVCGGPGGNSGYAKTRHTGVF